MLVAMRDNSDLDCREAGLETFALCLDVGQGSVECELVAFDHLNYSPDGRFFGV